MKKLFGWVVGLLVAVALTSCGLAHSDGLRPRSPADKEPEAPPEPLSGVR